MTVVLAPVSGQVLALTEVPDPVFAHLLLGPGRAVEPAGAQTAVSPLTGVISALHPHAFAVSNPDGQTVLVHLGIDTVTLKGAGFGVLVSVGDQVEAGDPVVAWDPATVRAAGLSAVVPVVALETAAVTQVAELGTEVSVGVPLFAVPTS